MTDLFDGGQLDLFAPERGSRGAPLRHDPELVSLASRVPSRVHLGTSSWTFPGWRGRVYRRSYRDKKDFTKTSLSEYAAYPLFRTVGIDRSYYAPLTRDELRGYGEQLPDDFACVMKVPSEITTRVFPQHPSQGARAGQVNTGFLDVARFRDQVAQPILDAFLPHQGPLVLSIPPGPGGVNPRGFADAVGRFLRDAPTELSYAFELRDARLFTDRYLDTLRDHGATHALNFWQRMPTLGEQLQRGALLPGPVVVRLMLPPGQRYADLKEAFAPFDRLVAPQQGMRDDVARIIAQTEDLNQPLFIIANNKAEGCSPLTLEAIAAAVFKDSPQTR